MTERRVPRLASLAAIRRWESVLVVLLIAICAVNAVVTPYFFEIQNLFDSTQLFAEKALIALSMTLVIIGGDIDLSVASIVVLCSTAMGWLAIHGVGTLGLVAASLVVGTAAGMFNGAIITRFKVPAIVVTIGTVSLFRGIPSVVLGDSAYTEYPESFSVLGQGTLFDLVPYSFAMFVVLAGAFTVLLHHTINVGVGDSLGGKRGPQAEPVSNTIAPPGSMSQPVAFPVRSPPSSARRPLRLIATAALLPCTRQPRASTLARRRIFRPDFALS